MNEVQSISIYIILRMKINSLKFSEITAIVNNKELSLDLFDHSQRLFQDDPKNTLKTTRNFDRYHPTTNKNKQKSRSPAIEDHTLRLHSPANTRPQKEEQPAEDILYHLQESLLAYVECISAEERRSIGKELEILRGALADGGRGAGRGSLVRLEGLQSALGKQIKNRILHLVFYLLANELRSQAGQRCYEREIRSYLFCEYYSRKFNFKKLTLAICIALQEMYSRGNNYELSRQYARKALRLAVVLNNVYYEAKMVEALYILNYYEGRLNENTSQLLSKEERKRILEGYSEDQECPNIFEGNKNPISKPTGESCENTKGFSLQHHNNFIENSIPNENIKYFQSNYHQIIKAIPGKHINVRGIMSKVASVGVIRKYFGKDNYITLKPQCHIIKPLYQEQVLLTHKKDSTLNDKAQSAQKTLKRIRKILDYTISAYARPF